jgi:transcriptional regulator with XRE-family HTH domain
MSNGGFIVLAGQELKTLRNRRNITGREVEQASRRIAGVKGDKRFCISNGWLAQLENGVSEPSICKLFSLSVIYRTNFLDLLRLYNVDVEDKEKYETIADPYLTQLVPEEDGPLENSSPNEETSLISETPRSDNGKDRARGILHAHLGLADFTMYPMIRPGALLKVDTTQYKLANDVWRNEHDRPIYFIELRGAYAVGWCELQSNQLLIIPHHLSQVTVRRFNYPREAEIVGRIIGYSTSCIDLESEEVKVSKRRALGRGSAS